MLIHKDKCFELGLPEPKSYDTNLAYIARAIINGEEINTRICRYIGIGNLHSLIPVLKRRKFDFVLEYKRVLCPFTKEIPPYPVDVIRMTKEQQEQYKSEKPA